MSNDVRDDMEQSALAMASKRKSCSNCWHHMDGDCALYSCNCATAVGNHHQEPPRWMSYSEGEELDRKFRSGNW